VWLVTCFSYTAIVLFEYCSVLHLNRGTSDWYYKIKNGDREKSAATATADGKKWTATTEKKAILNIQIMVL
jgi:hypothetical protein